MRLTDDARYATQLAPGVVLGLVHEICTDPNMMCLATAGALLSTKRFKGPGIALLAWCVGRRTDEYVRILTPHAPIMSATMPQEAPDGRGD